MEISCVTDVGLGILLRHICHSRKFWWLSRLDFFKTAGVRESGVVKSGCRPVVKNDLGNIKSHDYKDLFLSLLKNWYKIGVNKSLKKIFLLAHGFYPENLRNILDRNIERFLTDLKY